MTLSNSNPSDFEVVDESSVLDTSKNSKHIDRNSVRGFGQGEGGVSGTNGFVRGDNNEDSNGILENRRSISVDEGKEAVGEKLLAATEESDEEKAVEIITEESNVGLDQGYGWFIVLGAFVSWAICAGLLKSAGIFVLLFQEKFDAGALKAAWPCSILSWLQCLSGPLVSAVCNRYSVRTAAMIGSALTVTGLVLTAVFDNFYVLFFSFSLLQGIGLGFLLSPGLYIVSAYFDKRRGFASSLASAGGGVGAFVIVPMVDYIYEIYGYLGCFLILAGLLSNGFVVALLYRPFRNHQKYLLAKEKSKKEAILFDQNEGGAGDGSHIQLKESKEIAQLASMRKRQTLTKTPHCCLELKTCAKICFPSDHKKTEKKKIFHFHLLKDSFSQWYLSSTILFTIGTKGIFTFLPAACIDNGLTKSDAALILSIMGAVDTFGRIGCGLVLDFPLLKPYRPLFFTSTMFASGVIAFFLPFLTSFAAFMLVCPILAMIFGFGMSQRAVVIVDLMGKKMLASFMGLVKLFQAFGMLLGPLIFGAIRDETGSYNVAFYTASALMLASGICMAMSNVVYKIQARKEAKAEAEEEQEELEEKAVSL